MSAVADTRQKSDEQLAFLSLYCSYKFGKNCCFRKMLQRSRSFICTVITNIPLMIIQSFKATIWILFRSTMTKYMQVDQHNLYPRTPEEPPHLPSCTSSQKNTKMPAKAKDLDSDPLLACFYKMDFGRSQVGRKREVFWYYSSCGLTPVNYWSRNWLLYCRIIMHLWIIMISLLYILLWL